MLPLRAPGCLPCRQSAAPLLPSPAQDTYRSFMVTFNLTDLCWLCGSWVSVGHGTWTRTAPSVLTGMRFVGFLYARLAPDLPPCGIEVSNAEPAINY